MNSEEEKLITVFSTSNKGMFLVAKSILEGSGIEYFTKYEYLEALAYGSDTKDILVSEKNAEPARKLLENIREDKLKYGSEKKQEDEFDGFKRYTSIGLLIIVLSGVIGIIGVLVLKYF